MEVDATAPRRIVLEARPLTVDAWEPFGWIPVDDTDPTDVTDLHFEWADPHLNFIAHTYDEIAHTAAGAPECIVMYRHESHTQALMVVNCDAVVAVAPAAVDFSDAADLDTVRAFLLHPLDTFVLHRGTWHWGPFPVGRDSVRLLNVQGRRYAEDNTSVDLAERAGAVVEVTVGTPT